MSRDAIQKFLDSHRVLQLATEADGQPWVCSVYFVTDDKLNVYWLSYPTRRHSRELETNNRAAITMAIKSDLPVIGLSAEGSVAPITDPKTVKNVMDRYVEKYNEGGLFYKNFLAGTNNHHLYCFKPTTYVLFDELNHPDQPTIEFDVE